MLRRWVAIAAHCLFYCGVEKSESRLFHRQENVGAEPTSAPI
nr:MAG TPA: hypothetical protein [Caudoviricetes sp.]